MNGEIIDRIAEGASIGENDLVIEIGPGLGALTEKAAGMARKLAAIEIDSRFIPVLRSRFALDSNVEIIEGDILDTDLKALIKEQKAADPGIGDVRVIGNLPYYITTPIIMKLLEKDMPVRSITFMMQKEVADRICAPPGGRDYGALTLAVGYRCRVREVCEARAEDFSPRPKVDSKVLTFEVLDEPPVKPADEKLFFDCVRAGFAQRRKTLANGLSALTGGDKEKARAVLEKAGVDPARRAETLSIEEFAKVADVMAGDRD